MSCCHTENIIFIPLCPQNIEWWGLLVCSFVLFNVNSSRTKFKQYGFKGPCYLALSLFCSTQSFVSFAVYSTAQSLSVKRKPELDIAEKSELGRARICRCKTHNYHEIFLVCCIICLNFGYRKCFNSCYLVTNLLPCLCCIFWLDSINLGILDHHCNSHLEWFSSYNYWVN